MLTRWRSSVATVAFLAFSCAKPAFTQGYIIVDASGSMAGFAQASGPRLRGVVERLHGALSVVGPNTTRTAFVSQEPNGRNSFDERPFRAFAADVANPVTYRYDTPLQWAIEQGRQRSDEFIIITDGMETGARLNGVIATLNELANAGFGIGLAATPLHFRGTFYTEMEVILREDLPKVAESLRAVNPQWHAAMMTCSAETRQNCYHYDGDRPLLLMMFSRGGDLSRLYSAVATALNDNHLDGTRVLQLSPFRAAETTTELRAVDATATRLLTLPDLSKGESEMRCLANGRPFGVEIRIHPTGALTPPQPSAINMINVQIPQQPAWARQHKDSTHNGPQTTVLLDITCNSGFLDRFTPSAYVAQKGQLQIRFEQSWGNATSGWWLEWDAPNPWQFPFKVYKLAAVVQTVHRTAMERAHRAKAPVTTITLKAAGPR